MSVNCQCKARIHASCLIPEGTNARIPLKVQVCQACGRVYNDPSAFLTNLNMVLPPTLIDMIDAGQLDLAGQHLVELVFCNHEVTRVLKNGVQIHHQGTEGFPRGDLRQCRDCARLVLTGVNKEFPKEQNDVDLNVWVKGGQFMQPRGDAFYTLVGHSVWLDHGFIEHFRAYYPGLDLTQFAFNDRR